MKLHKLATVLAFGLCIFSALANANAAEDRSIRPFTVSIRKRRSRTFVGASPKHGGRIARRSMTSRRAYSWRS